MASLVLNRQQVREIDRRAIEDYGLAGVVLMENAGRGAVEILRHLDSSDGPVVICAGKGNNGGDGSVIARHLAIQGRECLLILCADPDELRGDAAINFRVLQRAGLPVRILGHNLTWDELQACLSTAAIIVDALLGTGTQGALREPLTSIIRTLNATHKPILAVDLPSGLDCDTGLPCGACVRATATVTFVAHKPGFFLNNADALTGPVHVVDIGVPPLLISEVLDGPR